MAFFHSYFDESGKFKDHRVISFCGVVATHDNIEIFNRAWEALLRKNQLASLHAVHALRSSRSLSPVIRSESVSERFDTLKPFVDCMATHLDMAMAVAIDVRGFAKWSPGAKKRVGGSDDPAYMAFLRASLMLNEYACREDDHISIMCDDDTETALNFYQLYRHIKKISAGLRKKFVSISFSNDCRFPALQAADLVAGVVRLEALKRFGLHKYEHQVLFDYLSLNDKTRRMNWHEMFANKGQIAALGSRFENLTPKWDT